MAFSFFRGYYSQTEVLLRVLLHKMDLVLQNQERIMATLDEVLASVADESTKIDSLSTFIAGLKQQIADALAGVTLPPAVQAKVDAVFEGVEANKAKVVTAMDANVPPA